jgi:hypothetical protein
MERFSSPSAYEMHLKMSGGAASGRAWSSGVEQVGHMPSLLPTLVPHAPLPTVRHRPVALSRVLV